jgi:uncharacterized protein (TIGR04255 family)
MPDESCEVTPMSEDSLPLGGLPPADRTLLARAPLEVAIVEVRFAAPILELSAPAGLRLLQRLQALGHSFARLDQAREGRISIAIQPGAEPSSQVDEVAAGWQLRTADGAVQATIMPAAIVLQTTAYERWSTSLRPVLHGLLSACGEVISPAVVARVGLRYVDRFVEPSARSAADWHGLIDGSLLGPVMHPTFGPAVQSAQQQVELAFDDTHGALLRHGPFVDAAAAGAVSYLVDIDVFDVTATEFDAEALVERVEILNRTAASIFQGTVTPEYLQALQRQPAEQEVAE